MISRELPREPQQAPLAETQLQYALRHFHAVLKLTERSCANFRVRLCETLGARSAPAVALEHGENIESFLRVRNHCLQSGSLCLRSGKDISVDLHQLDSEHHAFCSNAEV